MEELKEMYLNVRFTKRTDKNKDILDKTEEALYVILNDIKNNPKSMNEDRIKADMQEIVQLYKEFLCVSFPKE